MRYYPTPAQKARIEEINREIASLQRHLRKANGFHDWRYQEKSARIDELNREKYAIQKAAS